MTDSRLRPRPLESALFDRQIYSADVSGVSDVERMREEVDSLDEALVVVRVPAGAIDAIQRIEECGGRLCDILLTMSRRFAADDFPVDEPPHGFSVRRGDATDAPALHALSERAFAGFVGHWHADARLSRSLADTLYARWSADLARSATDERPLLLALSSTNELAGFLSFASTSDGRWHVPLTAVDPRLRGHGVLRRMLLAGMRQLGANAGTWLDYETQLTNRAALQSVAKCGLLPSTSRLTFHLWTTR